MADGATIRTLVWAKGRNRPVLFSGGKRDFIERHAEALHRIRAEDRPVIAVDWRDQGLSSRAWTPSPDLFDRMEDDFAAILSHAAQQVDGRLDLISHSMGGHVVLRALAARPALQQCVHRAVLSGPMLGLSTPSRARAIRAAAALYTALGLAERRPPGQPDYGPDYLSEDRRRRLTGDRERFLEGFTFIDGDPRLAAGGATWGWLDAAFRSIQRLREPGVLERIETPVLMLLGTEEFVVRPESIIAAAKRLPHAQLLNIPGGHHELFIDTDAVQEYIWPRIWRFLSP
jgi:lysophospholipase